MMWERKERGMSELNCRICDHCSFMEGNGNPNRYYCDLAKTECSPFRMICRTERHSEEFTIKRTPKWCPLKEGGTE